MKKQSIPEYPITFIFLEDDTEWILDNEEEIAVNLEWFNSEDPDENVIITDKKGNAVKILVENLEIKHISLK